MEHSVLLEKVNSIISQSIDWSTLYWPIKSAPVVENDPADEDKLWTRGSMTDEMISSNC